MILFFFWAWGKCVYLPPKHFCTAQRILWFHSPVILLNTKGISKSLLLPLCLSFSLSMFLSFSLSLSLHPHPSLTVAEYHEQEEIFKLRLGHLKKVSESLN